MPIYGLTGSALGYFISYALYCVIMLGVSYKRSGRRFSIPVFRWIITAGLALLISQLFASQLGGEYWGLVPTLAIAGACATIYIKSSTAIK